MSYDTMGEWALHYARADFEVFPVSPTDKAPLVFHGFKDATTDPTIIAGWWREWPDALIGCRVPQDMIILDVDPRHGGDATMKALEDHYGALPEGRRHRSGRGDDGAHIWFKRPATKLSMKPLNEWARGEGTGHAAGARNWSSGVDLLHNTLRYTILPPSLHPDTGKPYEWISKKAPIDMPGWLVQLVTPAPVTPSPTPPRLRVADEDSIADWYSSATSWNDILGATGAGWELVKGSGDEDGSAWRHPNATSSQSCTIRHGCLFVYTPNTDFEETAASDPNGYTRFRAWAILEHGGDLKAASRAARELKDGAPATFDTIGPYDPDDPWPEPIPLGDSNGPLPEFPLEVLPDWMREHAHAVAEELQSSPDLPAVLGLVTLSVLNAGHYVVHVKSTWVEGVNIYAVVAVAPGGGKSPAFTQMTGEISRWEVEQGDRMAAQIEHVEQKRRMARAAMKKAEDKGDTTEAMRALDDLLNTPEVIPPRLIADDATPEALVELMARQGGRLALMSSEGGLFDMMAGRYSDKANLDAYLKAWSGDSIRIDRISRPSTSIARPILTVGLTVQPSVIRALADKPEFAGRGLTARFMYSLPYDNVGQRNKIDVPDADPAIARRYNDHLRQMIARQLPPEPTVLSMQPDARREFLGWSQGLEERRGVLGDLRPMTEWVTKLESSVARVSGLLAIADGADSIDLATIRRAIAVGHYWLSHAKAVHDLWGTDERVLKARQILTWAAQRDLSEFSVRDVYSSLRKAFPTADEAVPALNLLTERGWLRPMFDGPLSVNRRGKDSPRFAVHPSNLWISASHARHAYQIPKGESGELSISPDTCSEIGNRAHDAHDAHENESTPSVTPDAAATQSDKPEPFKPDW